MTKIRILLADDHHLFREGLRHICELVGGFTVVGEAADGEAAVALARSTRPDVVLMDIQMPGMDGVAATAAISGEQPETGIIILTMYRQDGYVFDAIKAGARGYLLKDSSGDAVVEAVRCVARGGAILQPEMAALLCGEFSRLTQDGAPVTPEERLTGAEMHVLVKVAQGEDNHQIAEALDISVKTVANRLYSIFCKLHVRNRTQAALTALRRGWVEL